MKEKELPAKASMEEEVAPFGPGAEEKKLTEYLRPGRTELLRAIKRIVNPENKSLRVFYPSSGPDVANALIATDAAELILIDRQPRIDAIRKDITNIGGRITRESSSGNRTEIGFDWGGKSRKLIFYEFSIDKTTVKNLPSEVRESDVLFMKKSQDIGEECFGALIGSIKLEGFHITDSEFDEYFGFQNKKLEEKFTSGLYDFGYDIAHIQQKVREVPNLEGVIEFKEALFRVTSTRQGELFGIEEEKYESTFSAYRHLLKDLKERFNSLPEDEKGRWKERVIKALIEAPGDMSVVEESSENWAKQYEFNQKKAMGRLPSDEVDYFRIQINDAMQSPDRAKQIEKLKKFIEEGKKVFREVFPEWVS